MCVCVCVSLSLSLSLSSLVGLLIKASASRGEDPGLESRLRRIVLGSSHTSDQKTGTPVAARKAPGVIGSVLGLVGPV